MKKFETIRQNTTSNRFKWRRTPAVKLSSCNKSNLAPPSVTFVVFITLKQISIAKGKLRMNNDNKIPIGVPPHMHLEQNKILARPV
jgi:hypothetical protein